MRFGNEPLEPTDFLDPRCPFCTDAWEKEPPVRPIDTDRVLGKLDEYFSKNDMPAAERHLAYWLAEAEEGRDLVGQFLIRNERIGLFRKLGRGPEALAEAEKTVALAGRLGIADELGGATALANQATAMKAFGLAEEALPVFRRALAVYEHAPNADPYRYAGVCNNYALALADCGEYAEARRMYGRATELLTPVEGAEPEIAVTWLNLANLAEAERGLEAAEAEIADCVGRAWDLLDRPGLPRDGNYAFVCEKCAPTFHYYGYFLWGAELEERARAIYERA
ncbi:MAG: hypothetical protein K6A33_07290 [Clostridiales bacterium]|nr:hypothetical protein [Clostridiales bacterium]